jgi:hypothetical protein
MYVFNQGVPIAFYREFAQLVRDSVLHDRIGTLTLMPEGSGDVSATFAPYGPEPAPRVVGRGPTPGALIVQVLSAIRNVVN